MADEPAEEGDSPPAVEAPEPEPAPTPVPVPEPKVAIPERKGIQVGDTLPAVEVHDGDPENKVSMDQIFKGKTAVLFAVPGAFTPGCTQSHLPGFIQRAPELRATKGVDEVACVTVNDAFVVAAWGKMHNAAEGRVRMLADPTGAFARAVGLVLDDPHIVNVLGNVRSMRYSMLVQDGVVKEINVEPDGTGLTCSLASYMVDSLDDVF